MAYDTRKENKDEQDEIELIPVSEALRRDSGRYRIFGMITSMTKLFKMISRIQFYCNGCLNLMEIEFERPVTSINERGFKCNRCNEPVTDANRFFKSVIKVELQDADSFNDIDRLSVMLFDNDTESIRVGERVIITGEIVILDSRGGNKGKLFPYVYSESIKYEKRENVELTDLDIDAILRFRSKFGPKIVDKLVEMCDPSVIGHEHVKRGLLYCSVNTGEVDVNNLEIISKSKPRRERIHALLIGDPGLAKSKLLKSATRLVPNGRYESGENSSGLSLTAIVSKEEENYILRLGPASLAKGSICAINEFGRMNYGDQNHLLSIMEEGEFTINKFGINATIKASTTIVASANPISAEWKDKEKIDMNEIPALRQLIDRFDLIFVFRRSRDPKIISEYAIRKSEIEGKILPEYSPFLIKYTQYVKRLNPIINDEAKIMLTEFFVELSINDIGSNRVLDALFRLAKANARLKIKEFVDEEDAKEIIQYYNVILLQYQQVVRVPGSPRDIAYDKTVIILKETKAAISLEELMKRVCERSEPAKRYLCFGNSDLRLSHNKKVRHVLEMLLNNANVKKIQEKPVVLQWFDSFSDRKNGSENNGCDLYDLCDHLGDNNNSSENHTEYPPENEFNLQYLRSQGSQEAHGLDLEKRTSANDTSQVHDLHESERDKVHSVSD